MSDQSLESTSDDLFSFGVVELAQAQQQRPRPAAPSAPRAPQRAGTVYPTLKSALPHGATKSAGFNPYDSSGPERRKAWTSVRKR